MDTKEQFTKEVRKFLRSNCHNKKYLKNDTSLYSLCKHVSECDTAVRLTLYDMNEAHIAKLISKDIDKIAVDFGKITRALIQYECKSIEEFCKTINEFKSIVYNSLNNNSNNSLDNLCKYMQHLGYKIKFTVENE